MVLEQEIIIEGIPYSVVISDEAETLLAAKAAGRGIVGMVGKEENPPLSMARYLVESLEAADNLYLERVVRRQAHLPWVIGESRRILLREFTCEDANQVLQEPEDQDADRVFYEPDRLLAYIENQYGLFEYGLWAVVEKERGKVIGKAGITRVDSQGQMELAYHIFRPYRRQGYGEEACRIVLQYVKEEYDCPVYAVLEAENNASRTLLEKLGFAVMEQKYSESGHLYYLYEPC